ncbi:MAG: LON peptidase substrate-binding domain-containing protein [Candidatus Acidiferrum sp.]
MRPDRISLFPLNVVLFPGELLPLHIFEPRYRRMVRECLDRKSPFGMLLGLPSGIAHVGCSAEILEVTKQYEDGRMDILAIGREPYRVVDLFTDDPLLEGLVDYLEDEESAINAQNREKLIEVYEVCHTLLFSDMPKKIEESAPLLLSFAIGSALPLDLLCKQQLLELRSEAERQDRLLRYLREWALHLHKVGSQHLQEPGNGHGLN